MNYFMNDCPAPARKFRVEVSRQRSTSTGRIEWYLCSLERDCPGTAIVPDGEGKHYFIDNALRKAGIANALNISHGIIGTVELDEDQAHTLGWI
jgi:hypothetical protein